MIFKFVQNTSKSSIFSKHCFFGSAITWLKIIQTLQVGGVLESSGPPLHDGHRDIWNWCSLGREMDENESAILIGANCKILLMSRKMTPLGQKLCFKRHKPNTAVKESINFENFLEQNRRKWGSWLPETEDRHWVFCCSSQSNVFTIKILPFSHGGEEAQCGQCCS